MQICFTVESLGYVSVQNSMHDTVCMEQRSYSKVIILSVIQQILRILINATFHDHVHKISTQFVLSLAALIHSTPSFCGPF